MITIETLKKNHEVQTLLNAAEKQLQVLSKVMSDLRTSYERGRKRELGKIYLLYISGFLFVLFVVFVLLLLVIAFL